jgi:hypothetical protein
MPITATVNAVFLIDSTTYNATLNIPDSAPSGASPFVFEVTSQATALTDAPTPAVQTLLQVAVGGSGQIYVAVAPPADLIKEAAGSGIVQQLNLVVQEGSFNPTTGTFPT